MTATINKRHIFTGLSIALCACLSLSISMASPITINQNLILNPGAEAGPGSSDGNDVEVVPDWLTTGNFTAAQYGASAAPVVAPGPGFGSNFFSGGPGTDTLPGTPGGPTETDQATQSIDLSSISSSIDAGQFDYSLSGWFGGYLNQNDNATLTATFFNAANALIGTSTTIGGLNSTARGGLSILQFGSTAGLIPVGARSVELTLVMTKVEGFYDDGYADNLSFSVTNAPGTATPEPATWMLVGLSIAGLCLARKWSPKTRA